MVGKKTELKVLETVINDLGKIKDKEKVAELLKKAQELKEKLEKGEL